MSLTKSAALWTGGVGGARAGLGCLARGPCTPLRQPAGARGAAARQGRAARGGGGSRVPAAPHVGRYLHVGAATPIARSHLITSERRKASLTVTSASDCTRRCGLADQGGSLLSSAGHYSRRPCVHRGHKGLERRPPAVKTPVRAPHAHLHHVTIELPDRFCHGGLALPQARPRRAGGWNSSLAIAAVGLAGRRCRHRGACTRKLSTIRRSCRVGTTLAQQRGTIRSLRRVLSRRRARHLRLALHRYAELRAAGGGTAECSGAHQAPCCASQRQERAARPPASRALRFVARASKRTGRATRVLQALRPPHRVQVSTST